MRITALLGAGAAVDIGGPLSSDLTKTVRAKTQDLFVPGHGMVTTPLLGRIADILDDYFGPQGCHFEDIFYTLESLATYEKANHPGVIKKFKPHLGAFLKQHDASFFDPIALLKAKQDLLSIVADNIYNYQQQYDADGKDLWFAEFWRKGTSCCPWDIATLNYDHSVEDSIGSYEDGYEDFGMPFKRFNPKKLLQSDNTKVLHLHGSIYYGHERDLGNRYMFEDSHEDLYLYSSYEEAKQTWFYRSGASAQSHDETHIGPIITGLRKTDKLMPYPYSSYYYQLQESLMSSSKLIIMGYSFGDNHINSLLERIVRLHGDNRRVVVITYFPHSEEYWHPDSSVMDWPDNEMFRFIAKSFKQNNPFDNSNFNNPLISTDQRSRVYLRGVREAFSNHGDDILSFLNS